MYLFNLIYLRVRQGWSLVSYPPARRMVIEPGMLALEEDGRDALAICSWLFE